MVSQNAPQVSLPPCFKRTEVFSKLPEQLAELPKEAWQPDRDPLEPGQIHIKGRVDSIQTKFNGSTKGLEELLKFEQRQYEMAKKAQVLGVLSNDDTQIDEEEQQQQPPQDEREDFEVRQDDVDSLSSDDEGYEEGTEIGYEMDEVPPAPMCCGFCFGL